jgi:hypothetical protein
MSNGTMKRPVYTVEIRDRMASSHQRKPITLPDGVVGAEWREIHFTESGNPAGVPAVPESAALAHKQAMGYEAAVALAHTVLAQHERYTYCIELRIVQHEFQASWTLERKGIAGEVITSTPFRNIEVTPDPGPALDAARTGAGEGQDA